MNARPITGTALLIRKVTGEEEIIQATSTGITYSAEHDCYYCAGASWPGEIVVEVINKPDRCTNDCTPECWEGCAYG